MDRDGEAEGTGGFPHRIEARVVDLHERAVLARRVLVTQEQTEGLEDLDAHRTGGLRLREFVCLPLRVIGALHLRPGRLGEREEAAGVRLVEAGDVVRKAIAVAAGQVDHGADVARIHHLQQVLGRHRAP
jgi:hypothetical protein